MWNGDRYVRLDICDYTNKVLCNLYDSTSDISGQATDVFVITERNGWKELTFTIPSTCSTDEGIEDNFRIPYLVADYRIKLQTDKDVDWFLISEPKVVHEKFSKNVSVTAGHISQLLKTKNLGLEFSDEEGNNVGTAKELLTTILDGTGWKVGYVEDFLEDDDVTIKVRSIVAPSKTGAFKLISTVAEKFDAKPIYHGDGRIVDLVKLNPFSEVEEGEIPQEVLEGKNVLEIHYDRNMSKIQRTLNAENIVTRLYAYGSYGDDNGLCSLQVCKHKEYTLTLGQSYPSGTEFAFQDDSWHYFTIDEEASGELVWSQLDRLSRSYVWNPTTQRAYSTYSEPKTRNWITLPYSISEVDNKFDYLMDFSYYEKVGLLTNDMKQELAKFQREMPSIIDENTEASAAFIASQMELSEIAESNTGFLRLDISSYSTGANNELKLHINKSTYSDGVIYRSDYLEAKRNYFSWYCANELKDNGDPVSGIGSVVYIIHNTDPQTWEKAYVKLIDDQQKTNEYGKVDSVDPSTITLWLTSNKVPPLSSTDRFYLFCTNSNSGRLGVKENELFSVEQTLQSSTKIVTEEHPTYFIWDDDPEPSTDAIQSSYGWYYRSYSKTMETGKLYFCYGVNGERSWHPVIISDTTPSVTDGTYFFNTRSKKLYHGELGSWVWYEDIEGKRLATNFSKVSFYCLKHDMVMKGIFDKYIYTTPTGGLPAGNYAIENDFGFYWVFTTDMDLEADKSIWIDTQRNLVFQTQNVENVVKPEAKPFDTIDFPIANELDETTWNEGTIDKLNGVEVGSNTLYRSNHIALYGGSTYRYNLPAGSFIACYNSKRRYIRYFETSETGTFTLPEDAKYVRFIVPNLSSDNYVQVDDYTNRLFISNKEYRILSPIQPEGSRIGIMYLIKAFADTADESFLDYYTTYKNTQKEIKDRNDHLAETLGDLYREGARQMNEYVEGDEDKLYKDALEDLDKISKPEATYDITFLDLYASNFDMEYSIDDATEKVDWPDIEITDAVHLIDSDIGVNCWAFIDKLNKCYDQRWKTSLEINTNLSLIAQKSFTDMLTHIAEVANETASKQSIYKRAAALTTTGALAAKKLEGTINVNKTLITGGQSNWYTDPKGNMIFESADGLSALMISGYGFGVASTKDEFGDWNWRSFGTGQGFTGDEIIGGTISGKLIEAGTITTDQIHASVGQELEIGSNKALLLYATTDGLRPAGSLKTQVNNGDGTFHPVAEGDSYIEIVAKYDDRPAQVNIMSGGEINIQGSTLNLKATSVMNLLANSTLNIKSNSDIEINAASKLNIMSGSDLTIHSPHFNVYRDADDIYRADINGVVTAKAGNIAGFTIGATYKPDVPHDPEIDDYVIERFFYSGTDSISSSANGIYLGTDGINVGGKRFVYDTHNKSLRVEADYVAIGKYTTSNGPTLLYVDGNQGVIGLIGSSTVNITAGSTVNIAAGQAVTIASTGNVYLGNAGSVFTIGSNGTNAYIYNGMTSLDDAEHAGVYVGTNGISLGHGLFKVTSAGALNATSANIKGNIQAETGRIGSKDGIGGWIIEQNLIYADNKTVVLNSADNYRFYAGSATAADAAFFVMKDGTIKATKGSIAGWTIDTTKFYSSNQLVGISSDPGTSNTGIAFYAGSSTPSAAPFKVNHAGALTASNVDIAGVVNAKSGYIGGVNGWVITDNQFYSKNKVTGISATEGTNNVAYWAGSATPTSAPFRVTHGGKLTSTSADITGKITSEDADVKGTIRAKALYIGSDAQTLLAVDNNKLVLNATDLAYIGAADGGLYITPNSIKVSTTGSFELKSTNFEVSTDGTIKSKAGEIGNWTIATKELHSGYDNAYPDGTSSYVGLSSDEANEYAIWCGSSVAGNAPFRVRRNGLVYLTKVVDLDENQKERVIDLGKYSLGKLQYSTVASVGSDGVVKLSDGTTFSSAASVKLGGTWGGPDQEKVYTITVNAVAPNPGTGGQPGSGTITTDTTTFSIMENKSNKYVHIVNNKWKMNMYVNTAETYNAGYSDGQADGGLSIDVGNKAIAATKSNDKVVYVRAEPDVSMTYNSSTHKYSITYKAQAKTSLGSTWVDMDSITVSSNTKAYDDAKKDYEPWSIIQDTEKKTVTVLNEAGDTAGGPFLATSIWDAGHTKGLADCGLEIDTGTKSVVTTASSETKIMYIRANSAGLKYNAETHKYSITYKAQYVPSGSGDWEDLDSGSSTSGTQAYEAGESKGYGKARLSLNTAQHTISIGDTGDLVSATVSASGEVGSYSSDAGGIPVTVKASVGKTEMHSKTVTVGMTAMSNCKANVSNYGSEKKTLYVYSGGSYQPVGYYYWYYSSSFSKPVTYYRLSND